MRKYGTVIWTRITYKKIHCSMCDSGCRGFTVENVKIFQSYVKQFSHVKEIVESWFVCVNKFSWAIQSCFLTETQDNKIKLVPVFLFFFFFLKFFLQGYGFLSLSAPGPICWPMSAFFNFLPVCVIKCSSAALVKHNCEFSSHKY